MPLKTVFSTNLSESTGVDDFSPPLKALAVGDSAEQQNSRNFSQNLGVAFVAFADVSEDILSSLNPTIIFSPVLAKTFDCIELALVLAKLGFSGEYRAVARDLPKPEVIEREVRQLCPHLRFRIVPNV